MDEDRKLSSTELERLLLHRRRQEAIEGLRQLSPLLVEPAAADELKPFDPAVLGSPPGPDGPSRVAGDSLSWSVVTTSSGSFPSVEESLLGPQARLRPVQWQRHSRRRRRACHPLVLGLKKGLSRVVDVLIVLVLILFVFAMGFWIYDNYIDPLLIHASGATVPGASSPLGQGWGSSPRQQMVLSAPLPFVPYSTTVRLEASYIPVPTPAPGTLMPTRLVIPAIQVDTPVTEVSIENGTWEVARYAAGYHRGTARPGTVGNTVISGHKGMAGAVFARLEEVNLGDVVYLYAGPRLYRYYVAEKKSVWPYQVEVMAQTSTSVLTLITCTAYDTQRLIVVASLDQELPAGANVGP